MFGAKQKRGSFHQRTSVICTAGFQDHGAFSTALIGQQLCSEALSTWRNPKRTLKKVASPLHMAELTLTLSETHAKGNVEEKDER